MRTWRGRLLLHCMRQGLLTGGQEGGEWHLVGEAKSSARASSYQGECLVCPPWHISDFKHSCHQITTAWWIKNLSSWVSGSNFCCTMQLTTFAPWFRWSSRATYSFFEKRGAVFFCSSPSQYLPCDICGTGTYLLLLCTDRLAKEIKSLDCWESFPYSFLGD